MVDTRERGCREEGGDRSGVVYFRFQKLQVRDFILRLGFFVVFRYFRSYIFVIYFISEEVSKYSQVGDSVWQAFEERGRRVRDGGSIVGIFLQVLSFRGFLGGQYIVRFVEDFRLRVLLGSREQLVRVVMMIFFSFR